MMMFADKVETKKKEKLPERLKIKKEGCHIYYCVVPEYIHRPTKGMFTLDPPPPWNFHYTP